MYRNIVAVVLNYRTPEKTLKCLHSLIDQGISRIIVVENSEDNGITLEAMQIGLNSLIKNNVSITIIDKGKNLGFSAGVNIALAHENIQKEDAILLINSDAYLQPNSLKGLVLAIDTGVDIAAPLVKEPGMQPHPPIFYYHKYFSLLTKNNLPGSFPYITGACMLISHRIRNPQLFDEDFFFYGEDVMLGAKLRKKGRIYKIIDSSILVHEGSGSARNGSIFYEYHINRGHWLLAKKLSHNKIDYGISLIGRIITLSYRALLRSIRCRNFNPIKGFYKSMHLNKKNNQKISPSSDII